MKKYSCLIVDDEKLGRDLLKSYIAQFPYLETTGECSSAIEALQLVSNNAYDILFLDINMPQISGIELLRQSTRLPLTVLCTAYSEYALEGYELDVVDYLLKPIDLIRFSKTVSKIMDRLNVRVVREQTPIEQKPLYFFVKSDYKKIKIEIKEIKYIEAMEKYIRIHTESDRILTLMSMSSVLDFLPSDDYIRIHRSFIINKHKVQMLEGNMIIIDGTKIPISKANRKLVNDLLKT